MENHKISLIIPAFNEGQRIDRVIDLARPHAHEIIVIDDASSDDTAFVAKKRGAMVIRHQNNQGYLASIRDGFKNASHSTLVTLDGDGEHDPSEIPNLVKPVFEEGYDLVIGCRDTIPRVSERALQLFAGIIIKGDSGSGFRAIKRDLALQLKFEGKCICGVSILEPYVLGAKIKCVPIKPVAVEGKERKIAWHHFLQFFYVFKYLLLIALQKLRAR